LARGRKKIPSKIAQIRGGSEYTHRPMNSKEPKPPERLPRCPKHLDKAAKKEWKRAGKVLQDIGLITDLDVAVFAGYCDAYAQWAEATKKIHTSAMVYKKADGTPVLNPYLRVAREAFDRMMKAAVLLGLSPSSRASLKVEKPKPQNKVEKFMARKNDEEI